MSTKERLSKNIDRKLKARKWSVGRLGYELTALGCEINYSTLASYCSGKRMPKVSTILAMAGVFKTTIEKLLK